MRWCLLGALAVGSAAQAGVPSGGAWIVGTENGDTMSLVGDPLAPRSPTAFDVVWGSFDDVPAGQDHVTLAWGRDYADVAPLRGVIRGGSGNAPRVGVTVEPI